MVDLVPVRGRFLRPDGTAASGQVTFQLSAPLLDAAGDVVYDPVRVRVPLTDDGSFQTTLVATDDPGLQPSGVTYTVVERIRGAVERSWTLQVPVAANDTGIDLADVTPVVAGPVMFSYATGAALAAEQAARVDADEALQALLDQVSAGGVLVTVDADGTVTVGSTVVELATDEQVAALLAAASAADRARSNHTGSQSAATIADFTEAVQDAVAGLLGAGSNITLTYDDTANTLTVTAAADGTGLDAEAVRDAIGVALVGVGNIAVTVNDALDTITISTTATANSTDAQLRDRSTHTGNQPISTVTGLQSALDTEAAARAAADALLVPLAQKGAASGVASLDSGGQVPDAQLPATLARDAEVATAIATEVTARNAAISTAVNALVNGAPGLLDTLGEIATQLGADESAVAALTTLVNAKLDKAAYDANTIVKADADDTPTAMSVPPSTFVGRAAAGAITALTVSQVKALLALSSTDLSDAASLATDVELAGAIAAEVVRANAAYQAADADLTAIAGLDSAQVGTIASDGSGWVRKTVAQMRTWLGLAALAFKSSIAIPGDITATGTASAATYLRGDGAWGTPAAGLPFDRAMTADIVNMTNALNLDGANNAYFMLAASGATAVTQIDTWVHSSAGNVSVGVYGSTGTRRARRPGTRKATSGAVPCPAVGFASIALLASVDVVAGEDWLAISGDSASGSSFRAFPHLAYETWLNGRQAQQAPAHPLPATAGASISANGRFFGLMGS